MTPSEFETAWSELISYHACISGDCPHDMSDECKKEMFQQGYRFALESKEVAGMRTDLLEIKGMLEEDYFENWEKAILLAEDSVRAIDNLLKQVRG